MDFVAFFSRILLFSACSANAFLPYNSAMFSRIIQEIAEFSVVNRTERMV